MLASGKYRFMKNPSRSRPKAKTQRKSNPYRRKKTIARKRRSRRRGFSTQTIYKWARIAAGVAPLVATVAEKGLTADAAKAALHRYSGYDIDRGVFEPHKLLEGWGPLLATTAITWGIQKISGMLRRL